MGLSRRPDAQEHTGRARLSVRASLLIVVLGMWAPGVAWAQIGDQVMVYTCIPGEGDAVLRFDRRLQLLGTTDISGEGGNLTSRTAIAVDGQGIWSIAYDSLNVMKLVRVAPDGSLMLTSALLFHNPVSVVASPWGMVYAPTRIPLSAPGALYAVDSVGVVQWSSWDAPSMYSGVYPEYPAVSAEGSLWLSGSSLLCPGCAYAPKLVRIDPTTGAVLKVLDLPKAAGVVDTILAYMAAAPNGTLWSYQTGDPNFVNTDNNGVLSGFFADSGFNGTIAQIRIDAAGDIWAPSTYTTSGELGSLLREYSAADGALLTEFSAGGHILGFALGASGEQLFAVASNLMPPFYKLARISIPTGRRSTISLDPYVLTWMANGDPTGFIYANVIDQNGDNDDDGATNRAETLAGTSPYDPLSRPAGPKVYIDFTTTNAIILIFKDPDGLLHPSRGLDLDSINLTIGPYGNMFPFLLPFLTSVEVSPDQTEATAFFGGVSLGSGKKLTLDASVSDLTGAVGWDWQVSPPGDL